MAYQVLAEDDASFRVRHPDGSEFRVAKRGLGKGLQDQIRGYAGGGEVAPLGVPPSVAPVAEQSSAMLPLDATAATTELTPEMKAQQAALRSDPRVGAISVNPYERGAFHKDGPTHAVSAVADIDPLTASATVETKTPTSAAAVADRYKALQERFRQTMPEVAAEQARRTAEAATPAQQQAPMQTPAAAAQAPAKAAGTAAPLTGAKDFDAGEKKQLEGIDAAAETARKEAEAQEKIAAEAVAQREAASSDFAKRQEANKARQDDLMRGVMDQRIDPNAWWASRSTGQKIGASIGLILGGIGAGLTRGPNYALEVVEKAIDRDIDAQKAELGKKQNLLSYYAQQGHDERAAYQLAKADMLDITAAKLQRTAAQMGGEKALAAAKQATGALQMQAATVRQEMAQRAYQNRLAAAELAVKQRAQAGASAQAGVDPELVVRDDRGGFRVALDKKGKEKAEAVFSSARAVAPAIDRLEATMRENRTLPALDRTAQANVEALRTGVILQLKELNNLGVIAGPDMELLTSLVPNTSTLRVTDADLARLGEMRRLIEDRKRAAIQTYLR